MGINKIKWRHEFRLDHPDFEVTIKEKGKIIYQNNSFAGVINIVESISKFDENKLEFEGNSQTFIFGHPVIAGFSFDQLRQKMKPVFLEGVKLLSKLVNHPGLKSFMEKVGIKNSKQNKEKWN